METQRALQQSAPKPDVKQENKEGSIYHSPGTRIQAKDGSEYTVQANGSWLKTKDKKRWKDVLKEQRDAAKAARSEKTV
jgi:hypothetical protein